MFFFFFQAEDGIRDDLVTGVQTCALPILVTICPLDITDGPCMTFDGVPMVEALQRLEKEGAACVGLNCARGPGTMIPLIKEIRPHIKVRKYFCCINFIHLENFIP